MRAVAAAMLLDKSGSDRFVVAEHDRSTSLNQILELYL